MTREQEQRWINWHMTVVPPVQDEATDDNNWRKIYKSIYPEVETFPSRNNTNRQVTPGGAGGNADGDEALRERPSRLHQGQDVAEVDEPTTQHHEADNVPGASLLNRSAAIAPDQDNTGTLESPFEFLSGYPSLLNILRLLLEPQQETGDEVQDCAAMIVALMGEPIPLALDHSPSARHRLLEKMEDVLTGFHLDVAEMIASHSLDTLLAHRHAEIAAECYRLFTRRAPLEDHLMPMTKPVPQSDFDWDSHYRAYVGDLSAESDGKDIEYSRVWKPSGLTSTLGLSLGMDGQTLRRHGPLTRLTETMWKGLVDLVRACRELVERYCCDSMALISTRVAQSLQEEQKLHGPVEFRLLNWDISGFLETNYDPGQGQDLGRVLAFVGRLGRACAITVDEYMTTVWPDDSNSLFSLHEAVTHHVSRLRLVGGDAHALSALESEFQADDSNNLKIMEGGRMLIAQGSEKFIIRVAQQLAWLVATCQRTTGRRKAYAHVDFTTQEDTPTPAFAIRVVKDDVSDTEEGSCWTALMGESVLVAGFPIPERPQSVSGLESRLGVFAGLVGIQQAVTYRGGYVLKGRFHALIPICTADDAVQWHLINASPRRLLWADIDKHCPDRLLGTNAESFEALMSSRAILGWCGMVENVLGTSEFPYDQVRYSGAKDASRTTVRVSDLTIGFSHFLRATVKVNFGRHQGVSRRERSDQYETVLEDAADLNIFLHDTKSQRTVFTTGERLILQAILHAHHKTPFVVDGAPVDLHPLAMGGNLRRAMMSKANTVLRKGPVMHQGAADGVMFFKDKVQELYGRLDSMQSDALDTPTLSLRREGSRIVCGWEYLELVRSSSVIKAKQVVLRDTCGLWPSFATDPDIRGLFLFGYDFGDILRPVGDVCPLYRSIPEGLDYLGLAVADLDTLCKDRGLWPDPEQLTSSGWVWHRSGPFLFESCEEDGCHRCDRIQAFVAPSSGKPKAVSFGTLEPEGAIIFGKPNTDTDKNSHHHWTMNLSARSSGQTLKSVVRVLPDRIPSGSSLGHASTGSSKGLRG